MLALAACAAVASPALAQSRQPVEYRGLVASQTLKTGSGSTIHSRSASTIYLRFNNPNPAPADVLNVRCEFRSEQTVVKQFTIARITLQPGETKFQAPEMVDGSFNFASCKPGKL